MTNELAIDVQTFEVQLLESNSKELELQETTIEKNQHARNLDLILEEDLKELAISREDELIGLEYATNESINLDLSLVENFIDLSISPLEKLEADLPTKDFGWGCCKVTELKDYIKQKEMKEYEEEYEELEVYNI